MRLLRMLSGLVARLAGWMMKPENPAGPGRETEDDRSAADALAAMRDANAAEEEAEAREAALGGCYHDDVAYSLGYDANGVVELCGETFTTLDSGIDGGAAAALRRHRQNYDPSRDVPRFIVAMKPVKVIKGRKDGEAYGLPPGPLAGNPPTVKVWGEHVAKGRVDAVRRAMEQVRQECERRGVDISKSTVTVSVTPHDGQGAFARCEKVDDGRNGEPCEHPGCLSHVSHPCEGCGRVAGMESPVTTGPLRFRARADFVRCNRCDKEMCGMCLIEGVCAACYEKSLGGVN